MRSSRHWPKRIRRWVPLAIALGMLTWFLWPVAMFDTGRSRGFGITLDGSSEATPRSVYVTFPHASPWAAGRVWEGVIRDQPDSQLVPGLGNRGAWMNKGKSGEIASLYWVRGNLVFHQVVEGDFEGHPENSPEWYMACEHHARGVDQAFLEGKAGTREIKRYWLPRAVPWVRERWEAWQK